MMRFLVAALLLLLLSGCAAQDTPDDEGGAPTTSTPTTSAPPTSGTPNTPAPASFAVTIASFAFSPGSTLIHVGDTVTWTNQDGSGHTATSDAGTPTAFDSGTLGKDGSYAKQFTTAGTYGYHCAIHASMKGTITVSA